MFVPVFAGRRCLLDFFPGRWPIPLATVGYFFFMMMFFKNSKSKYGFIIFLTVHSFAWDLAYSGLIPAPFIWRWAIAVSFSLLMGALLFVNRWSMRRSTGFYTTFLFPSGIVFLEYVVGTFGTGTGTSVAYSFSDQLAFVQLVSVTGWTGIGFMIAWLVSVMVWFLENFRTIKNAYRGLIYLGFIFVIVKVFGHVRLLASNEEETVRVASVVGKSTIPEKGGLRKDVLSYLEGKELSVEQTRKAKDHVKNVIDNNFDLAEKELKAGARVVVFPEGSPAISVYEEEYCDSIAKELAKKHKAYLGLGYYIFHGQDSLKKDENKFVLITPNGSEVWEHYKSKLVPGNNHQVGNGKLPIHQSEYGKLSAAICYDMDFPLLMQQAGKQKVDIVFGPSNDWPSIRKLHVRMAAMRAIEQGYSLVRPTEGGSSLVTDPYGRITAFQNTADPKEHTMVAQVGTNGITTIYSLIGDVFSWVCIAVFVLLPTFIITQKKQGI